MSSKKYKWHKIADSADEIPFGENRLAEIEAGGKSICLAKQGEELFACTAKCPHASGAMAGGYLDPLGNIVCPLHRYKFSLKNGRNISGEGFFLKTYPVEKREDGIYIGIEEKGFFGF